ncbi:MAG TPA: DeoR/GlpR family DNA-binding transcription regulator [Cellulomonas sp.]
MHARERREQVLRLASERGLASVDELAQRFGVTASTIRRDLALLSDTGRLARTYGGAIPLTPGAEASRLQRDHVAFGAKRSIAAWAARRVAPGSAVFLDAGTTVAQLALELSVLSDVTVGTTSLPAIRHLQGSPGVTLNCLGGRFRANSDAFIGPLAESALEKMSFDLAFLGADGVSAERGLCEAELEQTRFKELVGRRATELYVLAHGAKLEHSPFPYWARLPTPWSLVTDASADPEVVGHFEDRGVRVVIAPAVTD